MKHSRNSQQIQGDFQDFEAPAPAEPEYAGEVTMALLPIFIFFLIFGPPLFYCLLSEEYVQ